MRGCARSVVFAVLTVVVCAAAPAVGAGFCGGDCNGDGAVTIDELVDGGNIALGREPVDHCSRVDGNDDGKLEINELAQAVRKSAEGCEFVAEESDFQCLTSWTRVRRFRIANTAGYFDEALAVANGERPPPYPVGTIIQLVSQEAMVKRGHGFFPEANDWEFFVLSPSAAGTAITARGRGEVVNIGVPCFTCHGAAPPTDFVCESGNGCVPLNLSEGLINALQERDPRCAAPAPVSSGACAKAI